MQCGTKGITSMSIFQQVPGRINQFLYRLSTIRKAIVPVVAGVISVLSIAELNIDPEVVAAVVAVATALGVYQTANVPTEPQDADSV